MLARRQSRSTPQQKQVRKHTHDEDDSARRRGWTRSGIRMTRTNLCSIREMVSVVSKEGTGRARSRAAACKSPNPKPSNGFEADDVRRSSLSERAFVRSVVKHGV